MRKIFFILIIVLLGAFAVLPFVCAEAPHQVSAYPTTHTNSFEPIPSNSVSDAGIAQGFKGDGSKLESFQLYLKKSSSSALTGTMHGYLYNASQNIALATSWSSASLTLLGTDYSLFTFYFDSTVTMNDGQTYYICVKIDGAPDPTSGVYVHAAMNSTGAGEGTYTMYTTQAWSYKTSEQLIYYVYGVTNAVPTPSGDGGLWGEGVTRIFNTVFPIALIAIPAVIGWKFARAWGFFAGLNVAIVFLNVYGLLPLWSVIVIIVIDGLLLFAKAGFRE